MKTWRTHLRATLALLLALASLPAWACARPCGTKTQEDLACVRLCAHSQALLTQGGKLASVGAMACGVNAHFSQASLASATASPVQAPTSVFVGIADAVQLSPVQPLPLAASTRGPPAPSLFLAFQHPTANGPPSLV